MFKKQKFPQIFRLIIISAALVVVSAPALGDQFDDQINTLRQQISTNQTQINGLQQQQNTIQAQLGTVEAQISQTRAQIQILSLKSQQVNADLSSLKAELIKNQAILDENVKVIYESSQVTPLEMLFSSNNFSDFMDKQQHLQAVKGKISSSIDDINKTKKQLEDQQIQLSTLIGAQQTQQQTLATQESQQQALLSQNQGQQNQYQNLISQSQQKLQQVIAARAAAIRSGQLQISSGGCGGYPSIWCNAGQDSKVDDWGFYNRECVSYVAWKRWSVDLTPQPDYWGNAADWYKFTTHNSNPQPGEIAVWRAYGNAYVGGFGHVAYVEANSGGTITLTQYNFDTGSGPGLYSKMVLHPGDTMLVGVGYIP